MVFGQIPFQKDIAFPANFWTFDTLSAPENAPTKAFPETTSNATSVIMEVIS